MLLSITLRTNCYWGFEEAMEIGPIHGPKENTIEGLRRKLCSGNEPERLLNSQTLPHGSLFDGEDF